MNILTLGAGQEVGRSCIVANISSKIILLDCGMHIGYNDARKFPDFSHLSKFGNLDQIIDCVIISHFHLDHCGALPYFTEIIGYKGPIFMTYPTKAVLPILLEDCRKILSMKSKDERIYSSEDIKKCLDKIIPLNMNESHEIEKDFIITPYYAGHVIGAAMFHIRVGNKSLVYTGDFSTSADKHLGTAYIDCIKPDLLITESTYGSVIRECRKAKERKFLQLVHKCINDGGKVLIPIFALGRAQELCILIDSYWERMGLQVPVYFAGELTEKANEIYKRFISYTNEVIQTRILDRNVFEFNHIKPYVKNAEFQGPCVIFSSPAMLHSGISLKIFRNICDDHRNLLILPGYCVRGTIGEKVLNGVKSIEIFGETKDVKLKVENLAFSAHADTMGIFKIIDQCKPKQVMLVHGEKARMHALKKMILEKFNLPVYMPPNGLILDIPVNDKIQIKINKNILKNHINKLKQKQRIEVVVEVEKDENALKCVDCKNFFIDDSQEPSGK